MREEWGKVIRIMTETAALVDKNDAKADADERAGVHRTPDLLTALVDCLSDDRFLHLHLRHRECAIREEAKLSQSVREARADTVGGVLDTAALKDTIDARRRARSGRHNSIPSRPLKVWPHGRLATAPPTASRASA
jgi:hypothetical protein